MLRLKDKAGPLKALYLNIKVLFKFDIPYHNVGFVSYSEKSHYYILLRIWLIKSCLPLNIYYKCINLLYTGNP